MPGFPSQQQAQARNASMTTSRLPNGKIASNANWNFGLPMGAAPGLQNHQQRNIGSMGTFAQSLGGSQPATPLDLSEFPSLSGVPQQNQAQSSAQAVWANAGQRATQQTPVQRQQPPSSQPPSRTSQTQTHFTQQQPPQDDVFPSGAQFANRLDDFRNGGQGISGQLGGGGQPQTGNIEEFPPLGRNSADIPPGGISRMNDIGQERRGSVLTSTGFGSYGPGLAFSNQTQSAQARNFMNSALNGQETNRVMSPGTSVSAAPGMSTSRSPQGPNGVSAQDKEDGLRSENFPEHESSQLQQRQSQSGGVSADSQDATSSGQSTDQPPLSQMSELDKFGLAGLLRMIHSESPDVASLAVGQDLMTLGLDLNQPEPLHHSFASPFVASMSAVPLEQDFAIPSCYNVANVQPLQSRIPSFSDETLFYIFYSMPRDVLQELVAEELMGRKWRYHKVERCWLTRDENYPGPVDVERGAIHKQFWRADQQHRLRQNQHKLRPVAAKTTTFNSCASCLLTGKSGYSCFFLYLKSNYVLFIREFFATMRIVEIIIDGFKSYAVRTVISGWYGFSVCDSPRSFAVVLVLGQISGDESFNSITGLNGSGKSNILDAICFVLGITNMSTVRAQNLQDLIYKRGQAGVTKASVTIVFDNRDKAKSPIGFEEYGSISVTRQIVLGGTSKYLINGHRAQQQTVQNLFQSVQLNINNPNFLIMQGRITKVLNMKAVEILSMIEEAAGTRMFEDRKEKAAKTMAKKEMKVREIEGLLNEEIEPKLEKLRGEKRAFLDFQQTQNDVERLTRLVVAHDYVKSKDRLKLAGEEYEAKKQKIQTLEDSAARLKNEIAHLEEDVKRVKAVREKELRKGGKFQALENEVKEHSHELVRLATVFELKNSSMADEKEKRKASQKSVAELEKLLKDKRKVYEKLQMKYDTAKAEFDTQTAEVETKEELLQTLQTGIASKEGQENGYQGQLQDARNRASAALTEQEQAKLKVTHLEKRIKEEEPRAKKAVEQNSGLLKDLESLRGRASKLETEMAKLGFEPGKEEEIYQEQSNLQRAIRELRERADGMNRRVANLDFSYSDPHQGFDRSKVKGLVAQLFTLDKEKTHAGTALEICAGGRLYNVVVDSAETGSQLLQNGKLRKRVTIIPLNKISGFKASAEKIGAAQRLAPGKVDLALSLIGYDDEVSAAMNYVFGSTLICEDAQTAKAVTFDPSVRLKSVTLEGDVYDPSGTLSGGSSPNSSGVLVVLQKLHEINRELRSKEHQLANLQEMMAKEKKKLDAVRSLKQELDLKNHEIKLTEDQINSNSSSSIIQAVKEMKEQIEQLKKDIADAKSRYAEAQQDIKRIEKDMKEFDNNKDDKLAELQTSVDTLKKSLNKNSIAVKTLHKELQASRLESEQAGSDLSAAEEQLAEADNAMQAQLEEIETLKKEQTRIKDAHDIAQAQLEEEQAKLTSFDDELGDLEQAIRSKNARITEESLEAQKLGHQLEKLHKDQQAAAQMVANMENEHEWIEEEKDSFGRPNTPYDFRGQNIAECRSTLRNLTERFQGMKKKINPKVMNMIDSVEKKEVALKNMMKTVVRDKNKIEETIINLDEYKKEALHKTWTKVNADFGQIFAELLPGSFAKLDPPEGKEITDGLEVKVSLGKVWKQSLTELSGGQRSLIALSLIMALLQFKPAPMYILDEVDAALDLSHTQNIGRLIKTRFKGSQFIVVSLKDGMFQNANRIFRTRFSEGTSVVQALTPADMK
uniref:Structural maintenance of chromosomes protein 2 n=2 Tax=Talaromyces marneffei TaxID=37727 RepID=A0A093VDL7_TALMA